MPGWGVHTAGEPVHIWPVADVIEHDLESEDCVCGPIQVPVKRPDGSVGWLLRHHSLDGREQSEVA
jgi:hypothetical protein